MCFVRTLCLIPFLFVGISLSAQDLNKEVLEIANAFTGGGYKWAGTGTPKDLFFKDTKILAKSAEGTYCSGFTFMVAFDVLDKNKRLDRFDVATIKKLQQNWYGSNDVAAETQCLMALEKLGLGKGVALEEAKPGDFVQFWRNNKSGHSVVFLDWIRDENGKITGIQYRSTQKLTDGIGDRKETIGAGEKDINSKRIYVVRLGGSKS